LLVAEKKDPVGPKTYGSESGSTTLAAIFNLLKAISPLTSPVSFEVRRHLNYIKQCLAFNSLENKQII
jgi:hypothetical protein